MTDQEILQRLAEIEGGLDFNGGKWWVRNEYNKSWNPLTDWSDLGPLIEKYKACIEWHESNQAWDADILVGPGYVRNASLPHAICLVIIEAHKETE